MLVNNEIGTIEPIEKIGKLCREKNILFHTDAVQALTKLDVDVNKLNIDLMSFCAHKIHGPKGSGALFVKNGVDIESQITGGNQEFGLRAGTENVAGIVGLAVAVQNTNENNNKNMKVLRDKLKKGLLEIKDAKLNGPAERICHNVNVCFTGISGRELSKHLDKKNIQVSVGSACSSTKLMPSHVLKAIGRSDEEAKASLRLTVSKFTTEQEIDYAIKTIKELVENLKKLEGSS